MQPDRDPFAVAAGLVGVEQREHGDVDVERAAAQPALEAGGVGAGEEPRHLRVDRHRPVAQLLASTSSRSAAPAGAGASRPPASSSTGSSSRRRALTVAPRRRARAGQVVGDRAEAGPRPQRVAFEVRAPVVAQRQRRAVLLDRLRAGPAGGDVGLLGPQPPARGVRPGAVARIEEAGPARLAAQRRPAGAGELERAEQLDRPRVVLEQLRRRGVGVEGGVGRLRRRGERGGQLGERLVRVTAQRIGVERRRLRRERGRRGGALARPLRAPAAQADEPRPADGAEAERPGAEPGRDHRQRVDGVLVVARLARHRRAAAGRQQRQRVARRLARRRVGPVVGRRGVRGRSMSVAGLHAERLRVGRRARVDDEVEPVAVEAVVQQVGQRAQRAEPRLLAEGRCDDDERRIGRGAPPPGAAPRPAPAAPRATASC